MSIGLKTLFVLFVFLISLNANSKTVKALDVLVGSAESSSITRLSGIETLLSQGGYGFDVHELAVTGQITIVEFYSSWCSACKKLNKAYQQFIKVRQDVVIRRIKMADKWNQSWAKSQYGLNIMATPHILIFDTTGKLLIQDVGENKPAYNLLYKWIKLELNEHKNT